jgi:type IX secretion system PorP/SprF family membrane protein
MKSRKIYLACCLFLQMIHSIVYSQDVVFSSFEYTHAAINPALVASNQSLVVTANTRSQWKKFGGSYRTVNASGEFAFKKNRNKSCLAMGVDVSSDNSSSSQLSTNSLKGNLAYHLQLNPYDKLSFGMYVGYLGFNSAVDEGRWGSQYNGVAYDGAVVSGETFSSIQKSALDVGFGAVLSSKTDIPRKNPTFQVGLSAFHLNRPKMSSFEDASRLPVRLSGLVNTSFIFGRSKHEIRPAINLQFQNKFSYILIGSTVCLNKRVNANYAIDSKKGESVSMGLFYRSTGAMVLMMSYEKNQWNVGVSHEMNFGKKMGGIRSASEINFRYSIL